MMSESRTDILVNRIASSDESSGEFAEFEAAAVAEPREWERLARALRDELQMRAALNDALAVDAGAEIELAYEARSAASGSVASLFRAWTGWAAAAALALAWTIAIVMPRTGGTPVPPAAGATVQFAALSADDALEQYLRAGEIEGRIISELPAVLVESHANEHGGLDVYYVRQLLERERIARVYELAEDEHGSYVPVQVSPAAFLSTPSAM